MLMKKQAYLKNCITDRRIKYNYHEAKVSFIEAVLARGDRRLAPALLEAVNQGAYLDAWDEGFDFERWMRAFESAGVDPAHYTTRGFGLDEILPWDVIDCGVTKRFLLRERERAYKGETTPACSEHCSGCGASALGGKTKWCK